MNERPIEQVPILARVFPVKTNASPTDTLAFFDVPGMFDKADKINISVSFTWDKERAEWLAEQWKHIAPVEIGGPAYNQPSGNFIPGMYLKNGYVITSRGCLNRCWFCSVWHREPELKELPITDGWIVQDDNILACSEKHIKNVFEMLWRQPRRPHFRALEAKLLKEWHVDLMSKINAASLWFAYDTPDDFDPLVEAGKLLKGRFNRNKTYCYCLIGYRGDTFESAEKRLRAIWNNGFMPFAMLWKDDKGINSKEWRNFQRLWSRPAIIKYNCRSD